MAKSLTTILLPIVAGITALAATPPPTAFAHYKPPAVPKYDVIEGVTVQDLDFGKIANFGGGRVRMRPNGKRIFFGRVEDLGGSFSPAKAILEGEPRRPFLIHSPSFAPIRKSGGGRLHVTKITSRPVRIGRLDSAGKATVTFGGDLHVRPNAEAGRYRGPVRFSVIYF